MRRFTRADFYQLALIVLGATAAIMFGVFLHRELFPEYKIYQTDYIELEKFRSTYSGEPPPPFKEEVKQIVIERDDKGPATIDRCISCHVALQIPQFSATKIARDINGNIVLDAQGNPLQIANDEYIWGKLDQKIKELTDEKVIQHLRSEGKNSEAYDRIEEAESLTALKEAEVDGRIYDVTKVLTMHPLMGKETRPFEYHPIEEYGCVSCHNGNGRGLTTEKAHGPVIDEQYEVEFMGPKPKFTEKDPWNDPAFSHMFNDKPGHALLFQTSPIYIGALIQAKCVQCHQSSQTVLQTSMNSAMAVASDYEGRYKAIQKAFLTEKQALITLLNINNNIQKHGLQDTLDTAKQKASDYTLPPVELEQAASQLKYLTEKAPSSTDSQEKIQQNLKAILGTDALVAQLESDFETANENQSPETIVYNFIEQHRNEPDAKGTLFKKAASWDLQKQFIRHIQDTSVSLEKTVEDQKFISSAASDIDFLTKNYQHGQQLYISQGCYACHRIAGFSRGGVGPELTRIGKSYPWYIKSKIVWPQGDLPTSTMPNEKLDSEELQDLMTFLLGQNGENQVLSDTAYRTAIQEWEAGRKLPWENSISPAKINDLRYSLKVFATEGCAACHRLKGFESNVGYSIQKEKTPDFNATYREQMWFTNLFPESISGTQIVAVLDKNGQEIDQRIVDNVRQNSIIEEIETESPGTIEAFYTPFKFASRAKNHHYEELIKAESDPQKQEGLQKELDEWKARVKRVLLMFAQEYGVGRLICPRPNWSGVYRTDEWLMEHFRNPSSHSPKSLMPVMPFDESKFYALTYMLDVLGIRNRNEVRQIWEHNGFNPELAFQIHCSQCHGENRVGNGPVSEWIYPIPKNLRNADFLRNLTKEVAIDSITHGVKGTPMPPWGEAPTDKPTADGIPVLTKHEIGILVDWLFSSLPGGRVIQSQTDVPKWQYTPKDVLKELQHEGNKLKDENATKPSDEKKIGLNPALSVLRKGEGFYASLKPIIQTSSETESISQIFDTIPETSSGTGKEEYFIKRKYFTKENIELGKTFFELNCAVCHGAEADGSGMRAAYMYDAKPRMLINLDWISTRDDLRLLRSIKYGVPGTAMTPWGDQTSALQRLQLVIFIRSLTGDRGHREALFSTIYKTYETDRLNIDRARINEYTKLEKIQHQYQDAELKQIDLEEKIQKGLITTQEAAENYENALKLLHEVTEQQKIDQLYVNLKDLIKNEMEIYQNLGLDLLAKVNDEKILQTYLKMVALNAGRYTIESGHLVMHSNADNEKKIDIFSKQLIDYFSTYLERLIQEKQKTEGKLPSPERSQELTRLTAEISTYVKLKNRLIANFEEASRARQKQSELFKKLDNKND